MKLLTIGDSVAQGFMSGAAARSDLCFSTILAETMGLTPGKNYHFPVWRFGGHPIDLERLFRVLQREYGPDIFGPFEWARAARSIARYLDDLEDYYERGEGSEISPYPDGVRYFNNIAVRGMDVADAWMVTPRLCRDMIARDDRRTWIDDGPFAWPNESFYRTALTVLNPSRDPALDDYSALRWLEHHAVEEGVENLILWLGANNALGTVINLEISWTPASASDMPSAQPERTRFNLWRPAVFRAEYSELLRQVDSAMRHNVAENWRVFIGTIPAVTIAPLAKGIPDNSAMPIDDPFEHMKRGRKAHYYKYYTYFPFNENFADYTAARLTRDQVIEIDTTIAEYNAIIAELVASLDPQRYVLVDVCGALLDLAIKRNGGHPTYPLPPPLKALSPTPNTKMYHADRRGRLVQGGIFSLDGVHPSAIGQGLLAWEFLKAMQKAKVVDKNVVLPWERILARDHLWRNPLRIMQEIYEHQDFAKVLMRISRGCSRNS